MSKKKYRTDQLFPRTNFLIGAGSIFNIPGKYYQFNYSETEEDADSKAIENDWGVIGQDIRKAIQDQEEEKEIESTC